MALHTKQLVTQIRAGKPPATHHLLHQPELIEAALRQYHTTRLTGMTCALSRCPNPDVEAHLRRNLDRGGLEPIGVIHEDKAIATCWLDGTRLVAPRAEREAQKLAAQLESVAEQADATNLASPGPNLVFSFAREPPTFRIYTILAWRAPCTGRARHLTP